ncbi:phage holin [Lapidilactobacillus gannanensis]|uniref:Phage holin n=1 Tax=Lapidilactobacillus gannanensis TaxID=2486002 RepID=A0ABW4BNB3_9LACO|nr:phage holin [Lapidilactobacillus gannanensis]
MKDLAQLVLSIAVAVIPVVGVWLSQQIIKNKKALAFTQALIPLAESAVVAAEKLGVTQKLTGAAKKDKAVRFVIDGLKSLGFTDADRATICNAVEKAFAESKEQIEAVYNTQTKSGFNLQSQVDNLSKTVANSPAVHATGYDR